MHEARDQTSPGRGLACRMLGRIGKPIQETLALLEQAECDGREEVRVEAVLTEGNLLSRAAAKSGASAGAETQSLALVMKSRAAHFARLLHEDPFSEVRAAAVTALGQISADANIIADLQRAVGDPNRNVRITAAGVLLRLTHGDDPAAIQALVAIVGELNPVPDRSLAFGRLMKDGSERAKDQAIATLVGILPQCEPGILTEVIDCLIAAGPRAVNAVNALERLTKHSDDPSVRGRAALAVADMLEPRNLTYVSLWEANAMGAARIALPTPAQLAEEPRVKPYPVRIAQLLAAAVADPTVDYYWRGEAMHRLFGANPEELSRASKALVRQLGSEQPAVRLAVHNILNQFIAIYPAELP